MNKIKLQKNLIFRDVSELTQKRIWNRIDHILDKIEGNFPRVDKVERLQCKHFQWYLDNQLNDLAATTRAEYVRVIHYVIEGLKQEHWLKILGIALDPARGGRKRKIGVRKTNRKY
jgi:hypothetical protein